MRRTLVSLISVTAAALTVVAVNTAQQAEGQPTTTVTAAGTTTQEPGWSVAPATTLEPGWS
ncbi:hypothetical protein ACWDYJ_20170 [Streptomyces sp. NPDC003042]